MPLPQKEDMMANYTDKDFLEEIVINRIDQILKRDLRAAEDFYDAQEDILNTLEPEAREKFEEFASNILLFNTQEGISIYEGAFLDGLRMGHKAF